MRNIALITSSLVLLTSANAQAVDFLDQIRQKDNISLRKVEINAHKTKEEMGELSALKSKHTDDVVARATLISKYNKEHNSKNDMFPENSDEDWGDAPKTKEVKKVEAPKTKEVKKVEAPKTKEVKKVEAPKIEAPKIEAPKENITNTKSSGNVDNFLANSLFKRRSTLVTTSEKKKKEEKEEENFWRNEPRTETPATAKYKPNSQTKKAEKKPVAEKEETKTQTVKKVEQNAEQKIVKNKPLKKQPDFIAPKAGTSERPKNVGKLATNKSLSGANKLLGHHFAQNNTKTIEKEAPVAISKNNKSKALNALQAKFNPLNRDKARAKFSNPSQPVYDLKKLESKRDFLVKKLQEAKKAKEASEAVKIAEIAKNGTMPPPPAPALPTEKQLKKFKPAGSAGNFLAQINGFDKNNLNKAEIKEDVAKSHKNALLERIKQLKSGKFNKVDISKEKANRKELTEEEKQRNLDKAAENKRKAAEIRKKNAAKWEMVSKKVEIEIAQREQEQKTKKVKKNEKKSTDDNAETLVSIQDIENEILKIDTLINRAKNQSAKNQDASSDTVSSNEDNEINSIEDQVRAQKEEVHKELLETTEPAQSVEEVAFEEEVRAQKEEVLKELVEKVNVEKAKIESALEEVAQDPSQVDSVAERLSEEGINIAESEEIKISELLDDSASFSVEEASKALLAISQNNKGDSDKTGHYGAVNLGAISESISQVMTGRMAAIAVAAGDQNENSVEKGIWVKGIVGKANQKKSESLAGYKGSSTGVVIGADAEWNDDLTLGLAVSLVQSNFKFSTNKNDKLKANSKAVSFYGKKNITENIFVSGLASVLQSDIKLATDKNIDNEEKVATAKYKSKGFNAKAQVNYEKKLKNGVKLVPFAGLSYSSQSDSGFSESGVGILNLSVSGKKSKNLSAFAGANVSLKSLFFGATRVTPTFTASVEKAVSSKNGDVKVNYSWEENNNNARVVKTAANKDIALNLGTDVSVTHKNIDLVASYNSTIKSKYVSHQGSLKLRVNF